MIITWKTSNVSATYLWILDIRFVFLILKVSSLLLKLGRMMCRVQLIIEIDFNFLDRLSLNNEMTLILNIDSN